jgi:hypothetical protein
LYDLSVINQKKREINMPYSPKNSHVATYLGVGGAIGVTSIAVAAWPVTIAAGVVSGVVASRSEKVRGFFKKLGVQTGDLFLDAFHYAIKDLTVLRDGAVKLFDGRDETQQKTPERTEESTLKNVPAATPVFNTQVRIVHDDKPIPLAESRPQQRLDVTG